tara:strand:+ start:1042 stop:1170 length:129 start_codon:yes stop_codon:yes gene_type:complete
MINNILIYIAIATISWIIFLVLIFMGLEAIDYLMQQWRNYGK